MMFTFSTSVEARLTDGCHKRVTTGLRWWDYVLSIRILTAFHASFGVKRMLYTTHIQYVRSQYGTLTLTLTLTLILTLILTLTLTCIVIILTYVCRDSGP